MFVDQARRLVHERASLHAILFEHLHRNVVRLGRAFYLQRTGIPQGSILSTLLCCLFYAHMEATYLAPLGFLPAATTQVRTSETSPPPPTWLSPSVFLE